MRAVLAVLLMCAHCVLAVAIPTVTKPDTLVQQWSNTATMLPESKTAAEKQPGELTSTPPAAGASSSLAGVSSAPASPAASSTTQAHPAESGPAPATNNNPPVPDMVIAILTMRRWTRERKLAPEQYLTPLVDNIMAPLSEEDRKHVSFLIFNVDKEPDQHLEVQELKKKYGDRVEVMVKPRHDSKPSLAPGSDGRIVLEKANGEVVAVSHGTMEWISGETRDATTLLFDARKKAPYVMFLEDDVRPTSNVVHKIAAYLSEMKSANIDDWFMVDLYTPNISWGRNPLHVKKFERYDYECCTQAMLFRSDRLLDMLLYETLHPSMPVDDNIRDFAREDESRGIYALVPNGFEHIGRYSSNPEKSSETVEHTSINFVP